MNLQKLTSADIKKMSYNEIIGLVRETNRTPGGSKSVAYITQFCGLKKGKKVLDIGTSTGITALELGQFAGCDVIGIDINETSLAEATQRAKDLKINNIVKFQKDDAMNLSFPDKSFDVIFCGNVTSLLADRNKALKEYNLVLKDTGFLAAIPIYYIKRPSRKLVSDVSAAIQVNIKPQYKEDWVTFFTKDLFEPFVIKDFKFDKLSKKKVDDFCNIILARPHLKKLSSDAKKTLDVVYREYMQLFRINLAHMGFSILVLKKANKNIDPELFTSTEV